MANEFKVKHGLIVNGSGSTVLDVQGSQGQLFSIVEDGTASISSSLTVTGSLIANGLTYPTSDGSVGQVLVTNGNGTLSFDTVSGGGSGGNFDGTGSANYITKWDDFNTLTTSSAIYEDTSGNIGIGTITPSELLHIKDGDLKIQTNADAGVIHFGDTSDQTKIIGYDSSDRLDFYTNGSVRARIKDAGLDITGNISASGDLTASGLNYPSSDGTSGQVISTDGSGNLSFSSISATDAEATHIPVKNTTVSQIDKGTPVYITGNVGNSERLQIAPADASDANKMPAVGLLETTLAADGEGYIVQGGYLRQLTTDTIDGTATTSNDTVFVKAGGGLTMTKPTGSDALIQNIAKIARSHGSAGSVIVSSILRTNDVPNLPTGKIWVGDGNTVTSSVVHLDETNGRLGVNTVTPDVSLHVAGNAKATNLYVAGDIIHTGDADTKIQFDTDTINFDTAGNERLRINSSGDIGIGTTSPKDSLHIQNGNILVEPSGSIVDAHNGLLIGYNRYDSSKAGYWGASDGKVLNSDGNLYFAPRNINPGNGSYIQLGQRDSNTASDKGTIKIQAGTYNTNSQTGDIFLNYGASQTMLLDGATGNVGIGTTSPQAKLHIQHTDASKDTLRLGRSDNSSYWRVNHAGNDFRLYNTDSSGADILFSVDAGGGIENNKVGIRTASPSYNLDVSGSGNFTDGLTVTGSLLHDGDLTVTGTVTAQEFHTEFISASIIYQSGSTKFGDTSDDIHSFSGSLRISGSGDHYFTDGNVGIGTTSPSAPLHVVEDSTLDALFIESTNGGADAAPVITLKRNSPTPADADYLGQLKFKGENDADQEVVYAKITAKIQDASDGTEDGLLEFMNKKGGANAITARLRSDSLQLLNSTDLTVDGDAGIGINSPDAKLHVSGSSASSLLIVDQAGALGKDIARFRHKDGTNEPYLNVRSTSTGMLLNSSFTTGIPGSFEIQSGGGSSYIAFNTAGSNERMRITSTGAVGIGTTSPTVKLEVGGDVRLTTNGDELQFGNANVGAYRDGSNKLVLSGYGGIDFKASNTSGISNQTLRMRINDTGQIGIGTAPSTGTHVYILHPSTKAGLDVFVSQSTAPTSPQLRVGRDAGQYYGVFTDDSVAYLVHRQDETGGSDHFVSNEIWSSATGTRAWRWRTANNTGGSTSTLMTLNQDGNLGIGTTSPNSKLDIQTTAQSDVALKAGYGSNPNLIIGTNTGHTRLEIATGSYHHRFFTRTNSGTSSERFRIEGGAVTANAYFVNSNVGIGTSTPDSVLHVYGSTSNGGSSNGITIENAGTGDAIVQYLFPGVRRWVTGVDNSDNDSFKIASSADLNSDAALTIKTDGKVGIGATAPGYQLVVNAGTDNVVSLFSSTDDTAQIQISDDDTTTFFGSKNGVGYISSTGGTPADGLAVSSSGEVGIGTATPSAKLHIAGDSSYSSDYNFLSILGTKTAGTAVTNVKGINLSIGSNDHVVGSDITNLYGAYINNSTDGNTATVIQNWYGVYVPPADSDRVSNRISAYFGDKVGIGTATPTEELEVAGDIKISGSSPSLIFDHPDATYNHDLTLRSVLAAGQLEYRYGGGTKVYFKDHSIRFGDWGSGTGTDANSRDPRIYKSGAGTTLGSLVFNTNDIDRVFISSSGNVCIGTTTASTVGGTAKLTIDVEASNSRPVSIVNGTTDGMYIRRYSTGGSYQLQTTVGGGNVGNLSLQTYGGSVGIGTTSPQATLHVEGNITGSGNIDINGTLTAAVKSFDIPHPTQEGKRLVYGVLEGPEHAVYVRGESKADTIILPEEWIGLVDETTITVQLTPIGSPDIYYYQGYEDNTVKVGGPLEKNYFYYIQATRKDIEPLTTVQ